MSGSSPESLCDEEDVIEEIEKRFPAPHAVVEGERLQPVGYRVTLHPSVRSNPNSPRWSERKERIRVRLLF